MAYQVGEREIAEGMTYVQPFPATGATFEIGRGGRPMWSRDGKELFYVPAPGQFVAVSVRTEPTFVHTAPTSIPRRFGFAPPGLPRPYDILPDGRFVAADVANQLAGPRPAQIQVVLNWFEELKRSVPVRP